MMQIPKRDMDDTTTKGERAGLMKAAEGNPLGVYVIIVLVVEAGLGTAVAFTESTVQLVLVIGVVLVLALVVFHIGRSKFMTPAVAAPPAVKTIGGNGEPPRVLWSRVVPRVKHGTTIAGPQDVIKRVTGRLDELRRRVVAWLNSNSVSVSKSEVRVHIFVADYEMVDQHGYCELFMPTPFQAGMKGHIDERFRLRPGHGFAGKAFETQTGQRAVIELSPNGEPLWPPDVVFTREQLEKRNQHIRWVITIPLHQFFDDDRTDTIGVLSIHGLDHHLDKGQLDGLIGHIIADTLAIAALVAKLELVRVTIAIEEEI